MVIRQVIGFIRMIFIEEMVIIKAEWIARIYFTTQKIDIFTILSITYKNQNYKLVNIM